MKTKILKSFSIICILAFSACNKSTSLSKFIANPELDKFATSFKFEKFDTIMISQIANAISNEKKLVLDQIEKDYPGLKSQMDKDLSVILSQQDTSKRSQMLLDFNQLYYAKVKDSWGKSGVLINDLTAKYTKILGTIPFKVEEFGGIIITRSNSTGNIPNFPNDSIWKKNTWNSFSQTNFGTNIRNSTIGPDVHIEQSILGHQNIESFNFSNTVLPDNIYQYISFTNKLVSGYYSLFAISGLAVSSATVNLSIEIKKEGVSLNTRDIASMTVVAPIIWYADARLNQSENTEYSISRRNAEGLIGGTYECMQKMENTTTAFGFGGSSSTSNNYTKEIKCQFTK